MRRGTFGGALKSQVDAVAAAAANARQMVLNRDPKLAALQAAADQLPLTQQQAAAEHLALQQQIDALKLQAVTVRTARVTSAATVALNATVDLTVTWSTPFPSATYTVVPLLDTAGGLANISGPGVKSQTATGCVVTFRANVALLSAVSINVVGLRFG